jgi:hypothetical protein
MKRGKQRRLSPNRGCKSGRELTSTRCHIVSAEQHRAVGFEQSGVQLLRGSEFDHQPVRVEYPVQGRLGEIACLSGILERIHRERAHHGLTVPLAQEKGKRPGFGIPRWWTRVHKPSFWFYRHFETSPCGNLGPSPGSTGDPTHVNRGLRLVRRMQYSHNVIRAPSI